MGYLQVFINAVVVALMAMYVYENERKMEKMSTKHDQTVLALEKKHVDEIKDVKQMLSTKAGIEKLTEIGNQQLKLQDKEKEQLISAKVETEKLSVIEHQQIEGIRKLTEIEH
ncbi:uncharacterized protein LOC143050983 isoform X2 [Mytilus galloprovincialis]|uniref:uncharacterized protein LOC143050983 isoform X2 n=1 Tax=Mytilus galloprovincialis TaxID=29158 RepID=UPI003F7BB5C5